MPRSMDKGHASEHDHNPNIDHISGAVTYDSDGDRWMLITMEDRDDPAEAEAVAELIAALDAGDERRAAWLLRLAWHDADPGR